MFACEMGLNTKRLLQELNNIHGYVILSKQERISDERTKSTLYLSIYQT